MSSRDSLVCAGCQREIQIGDQYIEDAPSAFAGAEADPVIDSLVADIFAGDKTLSGSAGGKVVFCEACTYTDPHAHWNLKVYDGGGDDE